MTEILANLLVALTIGYCLALLLVVTGTLFLRRGTNRKYYRVSVIVAARNEEKAIGPCLERLVHQDYPAAHYEIVVANDRSTDRTGAIINQWKAWCDRITQVVIAENTSGLPHKKHALTQAVAASHGEILVFTDADCLVPPGWITGLVRHFTDDIGLVAGYSYYPSAGGLRGALVALQAQVVELLNAGAIGLGGYFSCSGRSLAYRRRVFDEVGGYTAIGHSISGDDDLFLQLVARQTAWKISYASDRTAAVMSVPPSTYGRLVTQRRRHVSAARYYPFGFLAISAAAYVFFLLLIGTGLAAVLGIFPWAPLVTALAAKFTAELWALVRAGTLFGRWDGFWCAPILSIGIIFYHLVIGLWGLFTKAEWKG
jgi:cellulose synthase/poly-beta-1,6-N-acetylglucosamine synthase-like glycosyltransferase